MHFLMAAVTATFLSQSYPGSIYEVIEAEANTGELDLTARSDGFGFSFEDELDTDLLSLELGKDLTYNPRRGHGVFIGAGIDEIDLDGDGARVIDAYLGIHGLVSSSNSALSSFYLRLGGTYADLDDLDSDTGFGGEFGVRWQVYGEGVRAAADMAIAYQDLGEYEGLDLTRERAWVAGYIGIGEHVWVGPRIGYESLIFDDSGVEIELDGMIYGLMIRITPWR